MNLGKGRALSLVGLSIALVSQLWWTLSASRGTVIARIPSFRYVLDIRDVKTYVLWLCFVEKRRGVCVEWPVVVFPALHWQPWRSSIFSALCWALLILSLPLSLSIQIAIGGLLLLFFFSNIIPIILISILDSFWIFFFFIVMAGVTNRIFCQMWMYYYNPPPVNAIGMFTSFLFYCWIYLLSSFSFNRPLSDDAVRIYACGSVNVTLLPWNAIDTWIFDIE